MSQVKIATASKDSTELIGISPNNKEFGYIRVESAESVQFGAGGWLNARVKSALIKGKVTDLQTWVKANNIKVGSLITGKIVAKESHTPFYQGQQPKRAGQDGEILHVAGQPIYRNTEFTLDESMQDELIQHENVISGAARVVAGNDVTMN